MSKDSCLILLVEDDEPVRERFVHLVDMWTNGHLVADVGTLAEALAIIERQKVDLLITDLRLPDGMGTTAIRRIRECQPDAEVMVISVLADHNTVIQAIEAGATGFLLKDATPFNLVEAIEELMSGGSPVSPAIARTIIRRVSTPVATAVPDPLDDAAAPKLTAREQEILHGVVKGLTNNELAEAYGITVNTVPVHVRNIYRKLQTRNRSETIYEAMRQGLVER